MRAFFGLSPDVKTKLAIEVWRNNAFPKFNAPVPAANFHVTLAFLGQISPKQLDALCEGVEQVSDIHKFDISLNRLGYWSKPKALWLGCEKTQIDHLQLSKRLHQIANSVGLQLPKQDYVAHLTLARKCATNPPASVLPANFQWRAEQFHLFESQSSPQGVSYPIRKSWFLRKTDPADNLIHIDN